LTPQRAPHMAEAHLDTKKGETASEINKTRALG